MQTFTQRLANPTRFMELSGRLLPWVSALAGVLLAIGLYMAFTAPLDYQQGHAAKIMFVHVPSAWLAMFGYALVAVSSFGLLVFRHPLADVSAKAAAPIGAAFTFLCLVTGSLWGKPMWGAFWVWDPRLTSVLILFFLYLGLIALRSSIEDEALAAKLTAVLALVGIVMLPVIKFSVDWNSLHQPASVMRLGAPTIHPSLLLAAAGDGGRHDGSVRRPAPQGHAQRDPAPPRQGSAARSRSKAPAAYASSRRGEPHGAWTARRLHLGLVWRRLPWCSPLSLRGWCSTAAASSVWSTSSRPAASGAGRDDPHPT